MPGLIDLISKLYRMMNKDANETFSPATDSLEALAETLAVLVAAGIAVSGSVNDVGPAVTDFDTDLAEATNDHYNQQLLMFTNGVCAGQAHFINDYTGAARNCAFATTDRWTDAPANGDDFVILPFRTSPVPTTDGTDNITSREVTGSKADAAKYLKANTYSIVAYLKGLMDAALVGHGTFTTSSATVPADTSQTVANDYYKGCTLMPVAGVVAWQPRPIRQYTSVTDVFTLDEPFTAAPGLVEYVVLKAEYPVQRLLDIFNEVNAILELIETGATITTDATEQTVYINNIPAAVFKPLAIQLNLATLAAGDQLRVREYYRNVAGGALVLRSDVYFTGAQDVAMKTIDLSPNRHGVQVTIQEIYGAHNDIVCSILVEN